MMELYGSLVTSEVMLCSFVSVCFFALGGLLLSPWGEKVVGGFPRNKIVGYVLSAIVWIWVGVELYLRPVDLLAFVSPGKTLIIALCLIPASWILLENLLAVRAFGGLLMLWPMPVILAVRSDPSLWRLVPVTLGYLHLILGMIFVFHPWTLRIFCDKLVNHSRGRCTLGVCYLFAGMFMMFAACMLQPTVVA